jgi:hypothetical protein
VALSEPLAGTLEVRRLQYGIDVLEGRPTMARVTLAPGAPSVRLELRSTLPGGELRLLIAVGRLVSNATGRYYPRVWEVPVGLAVMIRRRLAQLGIQVLELAPSGIATEEPGR